MLNVQMNVDNGKRRVKTMIQFLNKAVPQISGDCFDSAHAIDESDAFTKSPVCTFTIIDEDYQFTKGWRER